MEATRVKKTIDIPETLYKRIMEYAYRKEIYKFGPAIVDILTDRFETENDKENKNG